MIKISKQLNSHFPPLLPVVHSGSAMARATKHPHLGVLPRLLRLAVADVLLVLLLLLVERDPLLHDLPLPRPPALLQRVPLHHVQVRQAVADDALLRLEDPVCNVTILVWAGVTLEQRQ